MKNFRVISSLSRAKNENGSFLWGRDLYPILIVPCLSVTFSPLFFFQILRDQAAAIYFFFPFFSSSSSRAQKEIVWTHGEGDPLCRLRDRNTEMVGRKKGSDVSQDSPLQIPDGETD